MKIGVGKAMHVYTKRRLKEGLRSVGSMKHDTPLGERRGRGQKRNRLAAIEKLTKERIARSQEKMRPKKRCPQGYGNSQ